MVHDQDSDEGDYILTEPTLEAASNDHKNMPTRSHSNEDQHMPK